MYFRPSRQRGGATLAGRLDVGEHAAMDTVARRAPRVLPRALGRRVELTLDGCAGPTIGPRQWGAYFVCGFTGYLAGLALTTALSAHLGLSVEARLIIALAPPASLLLAIHATKIVCGAERIVFFEKAILAVSVSALLAWLVGAPVATTVDLTTLGVGAFLAFGRIGCFRVACCHGRRARYGVAYRYEHAHAGFPARWVGLRVLPIQLADGALSASMVAVGTLLLLGGAEPGVAACAYVAGYSVGRSAFELARGDTDRPRAGGVTEAQWTALAATTGAALWHPSEWSVAAAAAIATLVTGLLLARRTGAPDWLWLAGAWHAEEVARLLPQLADAKACSTTREGLRLSAAPLPDGRLDVVVSRPDRPPSLRALRALADQLGRPWDAAEVVAGRTPGVFHILLRWGHRPTSNELMANQI